MNAPIPAHTIDVVHTIHTTQKGMTMTTPYPAPHAPQAHTLRSAADLIEHGGHAKRVFALNGRHCTVGALIHAAGGRHNDVSPVFPEVELLCEVLDLPRHHTTTLYAWNDKPERTPAEVVAALHAAADTAELRDNNTTITVESAKVEVTA